MHPATQRCFNKCFPITLFHNCLYKAVYNGSIVFAVMPLLIQAMLISWL